MKIALILILALVMISGCQQKTISKDFCEADSDCVCQGIDKETESCFLGNKDYYQTDKVDKERDCADFCTGIGNFFEIKCVKNTCKQVKRAEFEQKTRYGCTNDADCVAADCCHAKECVNTANKPECEGIMCSMNCEPETLDCGGSCVCQEGYCKALIPDSR